MRTFEPETVEALDDIAAGIRSCWVPGRSCRLPARVALVRVLRIRSLVGRGMIEPGRALRAARAAAWDAEERLR
ncbi:hypothetical protein HCU64_00065 [Methylobacterium sp. C25]|uniref:hypothetical protein n=1 Tax=Methylobacterium sp. C25 TaxID=2721622 RepID=UPI001F1CF407|nr:hypothetical protein [Methylobacterium sp. C25]MCE4222133.1 hypothetical protein [Methylobacterium sp. C25]